MSPRAPATRPRRGGRAAGSTAGTAAARAGPPPIPLRDPALIALALAVAGLVAAAVTWRLTTPDFWQHLLVGKAIWTLGRVPREHLWTWPSYGRREVLPSWGFAALLWPFWSAGGVVGLQVWRWLTTLLAFGVAWSTARRLGARGVMPLVVIAASALAYRARAQVRPETLVAVLLALEIAVLERRRARGGGGLPLIAIAVAWANVHLSYFLGLALIAIHASVERRGIESRADGWKRTLVAAREEHVVARDSATGRGLLRALRRVDGLPGFAVLGLAAVASLVNPFGWRALAQPFEYAIVWRNEPVYRSISELAPLWTTWRSELRTGLPLLVLLWPLVIAVRALRRPRSGPRFDAVEVATCVLFTAAAIANARLAGFLVIANVPYLARDLSELAGVLTPRALAGGRARAVAAVVLVALVSLPAWSDPRFRFGIGWVPTLYPSAACDFLRAHDVRGRTFNPYWFGGYVAWRFWPERDRLPFMDIHQSGTREDRSLAAYAPADPDSLAALDRERDFQVAILDGHPEWVRGDRLLDQFDADTTWALVFRDDAAALYLRRRGATAAVADSYAYRVMPGGNERLAQMGDAVRRDSSLRAELRRELERSAASSPLNARASSNLANLDFLTGDRAAARRELEHALAVEPAIAGVHRRLGYLDLADGRWRDAIRELEAELARGAPEEDEWARIGDAWEKLADRGRAAAAYRKHLDTHFDDERVREALRRVSG